MPIIGIDLGKTNSLAAYFDGNESVIIPNGLGGRLTPSVVSVLENDEIVVGDAAKERLITCPQRTAAAFKRFMGTGKKYELGKFSFSPTELSSFILASLKADAEAFLKTKITEAVVSVPAYFSDEQRRATKQAGEFASLTVERLINEPSAAALAYGLQGGEEDKKFLVFDLGGGTFDVSVLDAFENVMEVRAVAGNNQLGGEDFTAALAQHFTEHFYLDAQTLDKKVLSAIQKQAEGCKIALSFADEARMSCKIAGEEYTLTVTAAEYGDLVQGLLEKLRSPVRRALRDADIPVGELDDVILVGGSTKMPLVRTMVTKLFGRLPTCALNPDEVVGLGAGIYAAMKERNETLREEVLTDVCQYTLGIDIAVGNGFGGLETGRLLPIIERNTTVPFSKVERLYSVADNQKSVRIGIYQGENRLVINDIKLGEIQLDVLPSPRGTAVCDVRYTYDINGILEV